MINMSMVQFSSAMPAGRNVRFGLESPGQKPSRIQPDSFWRQPNNKFRASVGSEENPTVFQLIEHNDTMVAVTESDAKKTDLGEVQKYTREQFENQFNEIVYLKV